MLLPVDPPVTIDNMHTTLRTGGLFHCHRFLDMIKMLELDELIPASMFD
jgi:hypothetical protein